jgi:hypothetical protein
MTLSPSVDTPEVLAQRQLDAYNAHDVEAFSACFSDDVEAFELPAMTLLFRGREALRERYGPYFEGRRPAATLTSPRITLSSFAIDAEHVVMADGKSLDAVAIYHIEAGLIRRIWFVR